MNEVKTSRLGNTPRLGKIPRLLDLSNKDMERECLTLEQTSRIEASPKKWSHINEGNPGNCESSISLNSVKRSHELPVKQTSRKKRPPERGKFKTPVKGTSKTSMRVQKNPLRKPLSYK